MQYFHEMLDSLLFSIFDWGSGKSTVSFAIAMYDSFLRRDETRNGLIELDSIPSELETMFIVDGDDYRDCSMNYQRVLKYAR